MYFTLSQCRLRLIGYVLIMDNERIPKSQFWIGRPSLSFKDICKRDLKSLKVSTNVSISGRSMLMTTTNGDILHTEVLKKEKSSSFRDVSIRRILHHCVCLVLV